MFVCFSHNSEYNYCHCLWQIKVKFLHLAAICDTKENAVLFLQQHRIIHAQWQCTNGHNIILSFGSDWICWRCRFCRYGQDKGMHVGTWLEELRLDVFKVVLFIYCWSCELTSLLIGGY